MMIVRCHQKPLQSNHKLVLVRRMLRKLIPRMKRLVTDNNNSNNNNNTNNISKASSIFFCGGGHIWLFWSDVFTGYMPGELLCQHMRKVIKSDQFCDTLCSDWLLYATDAALDSTVDQFRNNICAYWLHVEHG